jgi:ribokinase
VSGANLTIEPQTIITGWAALWSCKVMLLQNEIPEAVSIVAAREAHQRGAKIMLNAAPARAMSDDLLDLVDVLIVNRVEATMLTGDQDPAAALPKLHHRARDVVLTLGSEGLIVMTRHGERTDIPAYKVNMISSHGAGDCFCGTLAARLAKGDDLLAACRFASIAAALFVSTPEARQNEVNGAAVMRLLA